MNNFGSGSLMRLSALWPLLVWLLLTAGWAAAGDIPYLALMRGYTVASPADEARTLIPMQVKRRLNAHGDEFHALSVTPDGKQLLVGAGDALKIWDIRKKRFVSSFRQGFPVYAVTALPGGREALTGGGPLGGESSEAVVRIWNLRTGRWREPPGAGRTTITFVAVDPCSGCFAAADLDGLVYVWNRGASRLLASYNTERFVCGLALANRRLYLSTAARTIDTSADESEPDLFTRVELIAVDKTLAVPRCLVEGSRNSPFSGGDLLVSPDGHWLAIPDIHGNTLVWDLKEGCPDVSLSGEAAAWVDRNTLLVLEDDAPTCLVKIGVLSATESRKFSTGGGMHANNSPGSPTDWVVTPDRRTAWTAYRMQAGLARWDLHGKKAPELVAHTVGLVFALDVCSSGSSPGKILTGGDDGFVRLWSSDNLSLLREVRVPFGVSQGAALLPGGQRAVISWGKRQPPTGIGFWDLSTGELKELFQSAKGGGTVAVAGNLFAFSGKDHVAIVDCESGQIRRKVAEGIPVDRFSLDAGGDRIAVAGEDGRLYLYSTSDGALLWAGNTAVDSLTTLALDHAGTFIYTTEFGATIRKWDTQSQEMTELSGHRGQCCSLHLSQDGKLLLLGGNHHDMMAFDVQDGKQVLYVWLEEADFYVTNAWLEGRRLLLTTDTGILLDAEVDVTTRVPLPATLEF